MSSMGAPDLSQVFNLNDFETIAQERLVPPAYAYLSGGAGDEITLRENVDAFRRRQLRPRVLRDASAVDTATTYLDTRVSFPVGLAPAAQQALAHADGEIATARAARDAGVSAELVERAHAAGFGAIVLTVDLPYPGYRERELRHPIVHRGGVPFGNLTGIRPESTENTALLSDVISASTSWDDLDCLLGVSSVRVLV
jgi:isopentenyl diphosphate isomerase/L-lactate dehydrogenase-like FMN-dependent dehydrogenase